MSITWGNELALVVLTQQNAALSSVITLGSLCLPFYMWDITLYPTIPKKIIHYLSKIQFVIEFRHCTLNVLGRE